MNGDVIFSIIIALLLILSIFYIGKNWFINLYIGLTKNARIKWKLAKLIKNYDYLYMNNLCIRLDAGKYMNIDHVVFGDKYIYVLETKFWLGYILGKDEDEKWLLNDGDKTKYVENPLRYNQLRIKVLSSILNISEDNFINVICIADCGKIKEVSVKKALNVVLGEKDLLEYIKSNEKNAPVNVYKTEEIEKLAAILFDYHKASLEDKEYYQKNKTKY